MYSPAIIQRRVATIEARTGIRLVRYDAGRIQDIASYLTRIRGHRDLTREEQQFIRNERILVKLDYTYFSSRYCKIIRDGVDGGGLGVMQDWESQTVIDTRVARLEQQCWDAFTRGEPVDGILISLNKARQLGATAKARSYILHRLLFWSHTRGFSASVDEDKVLELYDRDKRIYDNLPFYLQPSLDSKDGSFDKKSEHIRFGKLDSFILYQHAGQKSGLGQGRQFEVSHITEAASFPYPRMLEHDYFPTIPQSPWALCIAESTPQGRGNWWHTWSEKVRLGRMPRWSYLFVPVYIEKKKYRRTPPADWIPSPLTLERANKIEQTSERVVGHTVLPSRDHLYWWETTRQEYQEMGSLSIFLTNYADTPEESFQFSSGAALNPELLEKIRMQNTEPVSYEFERVIS